MFTFFCYGFWLTNWNYASMAELPSKDQELVEKTIYLLTQDMDLDAIENGLKTAQAQALRTAAIAKDAAQEALGATKTPRFFSLKKTREAHGEATKQAGNWAQTQAAIAAGELVPIIANGLEPFSPTSSRPGPFAVILRQQSADERQKTNFPGLLAKKIREIFVDGKLMRECPPYSYKALPMQYGQLLGVSFASVQQIKALRRRWEGRIPADDEAHHLIENHHLHLAHDGSKQCFMHQAYQTSIPEQFEMGSFERKRGFGILSASHDNPSLFPTDLAMNHPTSLMRNREERWVFDRRPGGDRFLMRSSQPIALNNYQTRAGGYFSHALIDIPPHIATKDCINAIGGPFWKHPESNEQWEELGRSTNNIAKLPIMHALPQGASFGRADISAQIAEKKELAQYCLALWFDKLASNPKGKMVIPTDGENVLAMARFLAEILPEPLLARLSFSTLEDGYGRTSAKIIGVTQSNLQERPPYKDPNTFFPTLDQADIAPQLNPASKAFAQWCVARVAAGRWDLIDAFRDKLAKEIPPEGVPADFAGEILEPFFKKWYSPHVNQANQQNGTRDRGTGKG